MAVGLERPVVAEPMPEARPKRRYRFVDYSTQAYLAIVALIALFFHDDSFPQWWMLVLAHAGAMVAIHFIVIAHAARPNNPILTFVRTSYALFLVIYLYQETGWVNTFLTGMYHDQFFIDLEQAVFGYQPVVKFMEALPYRPVAEVLYFVYFSYYGLVGFTGFTLYAVDRKMCFRYVSVVSLVFFVCYLAFMITPVLGPKAILIPEYAEAVGIDYHVPPVPAGVDAAFFYHFMSTIHRNAQVIGAAFPSSHVAVALSVLYFCWLSFRRGRYVILTLVTLLAVSTVYCRYHYAVDVFGGIIFAAAVIPIGEWLYRRI